MPYLDLWSKEGFRKIPKVVLWFDEPVTPVERYGLDGDLRGLASRSDYHFGIWDGYWRDVAQKRWGLKSNEIHLSADELEYTPSGDGSLEKDVLFVGMLHSQASISERMGQLPRGMSSVGALVQRQMTAACEDPEWKPIPSWDIVWEHATQELSPKERILFQTELKHDPEAAWRLRWSTWALAKNAVRIRMLRKALEITPLHIFCEQKQLGHATESEWRKLLGESESRLNIVDSSGLSAEDLAKLHQRGSLHLQATDPQSVRGGIPYRVFQAAACARPLLTDLKPELEKCFETDREILGFRTADDFAVSLTRLLENRTSLGEIGRAARARFEHEHLWRHRIETIESWIASQTH